MQTGMPYARHIEWSFHSTEPWSGPNWKRVQFYTAHSIKRDWRKSREKHQEQPEKCNLSRTTLTINLEKYRK